jgi:transcriptional regulator with XRE-family HTH domain
MTRNAVGLIERGERDPSWGAVARIAAELRLSITDLARAYEEATARPRSR